MSFAIEAWEDGDREHCLVIARDIPCTAPLDADSQNAWISGRKQYAVVDRRNVDLFKGPNLYVILGEAGSPVRPFFDFDELPGDREIMSGLPEVAQGTVINTRIESICVKLQVFLFEMMVDCDWRPVLDSLKTRYLFIYFYRTSGKLSFHVHISGVSISLAKLKGLSAQTITMCDQCVYAPHRAFRLPNSAKACPQTQPNRPLLFERAYYWDWKDTRSSLIRINKDHTVETREHESKQSHAALIMSVGGIYSVVQPRIIGDKRNRDSVMTPQPDCSPLDTLFALLRQLEVPEEVFRSRFTLKNMTAKTFPANIHSNCHYCVIGRKWHDMAVMECSVYEQVVVFHCWAEGCSTTSRKAEKLIVPITHMANTVLLASIEV